MNMPNAIPAPTPIQQTHHARRIEIAAKIAESVEFLIGCLKYHTQADIDAGIEHAVDAYLNRNHTSGSAIPRGVYLARQRIKKRQALAALGSASVIDFLRHKNRRHDARHAQPLNF
jgi:hypothetical protein